MEPWNRKLAELERMLEALSTVWQQRAAARRRKKLPFARGISDAPDDWDDDDPDSLIGARLRPHPPLGGSAIALREPDDDLFIDALAACGTERPSRVR
jgi:hypothetical protein